MELRDGKNSLKRLSKLELSHEEFLRISNFVMKEYGIKLDPEKRMMVRSRLVGRLRALGEEDFGRYFELIERSSSGERQNFISAITTNVTGFFREIHHFDKFGSDLLPNLVESAKCGNCIRIWSAGCSTGQEPYSIASCIIKNYPEAADLNIKIIATDVDSAALRSAKSATYPLGDCSLPVSYPENCIFQEIQNENSRIIQAEVANLVEFQQLNINGSWPNFPEFQVIFCRNVAIYFERCVQAKLWARIAKALSPGGVVFIGHSERISGDARKILSPLGVTTYRKCV